MKNMILIAVLFFNIMGVNGQERNDSAVYVLGGSISFLSYNETYSPVATLRDREKSENTSFSISPLFGYQINPQSMLGLQLNYGRENFTINDSNTGRVDLERISKEKGLELFVRYTFNPQNKFKFYLQPYAQYSLLNIEEMTNSNEFQNTEAKLYGIGVSGGFLYNINESFRISLRIGDLSYVNGISEVDNFSIREELEYDLNSLQANLDLSTISFGIEIILPQSTNTSTSE